jgi:hypothetical protein
MSVQASWRLPLFFCDAQVLLIDLSVKPAHVPPDPKSCSVAARDGGRANKMSRSLGLF